MFISILNKNTVYLPHLAVIRKDKDTTKLRVVFDASAKGTNGASLNNTMMTGPTLQTDLRSLVIRWRSHKFCVIGDIVKMYLQVRIAKEHTELQLKGVIIPQTDLEIKKKLFHTKLEENSVWERFSTFSKMRRVLAYCRRMLKSTEGKRTRYLTAEELKSIAESCIKYYQECVYKEKIDDIRKTGRVKNRRTLLTLTPFLDKNGLLRVGGRRKAPNNSSS